MLDCALDEALTWQPARDSGRWRADLVEVLGRDGGGKVAPLGVAVWDSSGGAFPTKLGDGTACISE